MSEDTMPAYPEYEQLLAAAEAGVAADGGFVDPVKLRRFQRLGRSYDWRVSVLGHGREPTLREMHMLLIADERGIEPPLPEWIARRRAEQAEREAAQERRVQEWWQRCVQEWTALVKALPVPVHLAYNYSGPHHYEMHVSGAVHILAGEDLRVGRLYRPVRAPFCLPRRFDAGHLDLPYERVPSCKACIDRAVRLTGVQAPTLRAGYYRPRLNREEPCRP